MQLAVRHKTISMGRIALIAIDDPHGKSRFQHRGATFRPCRGGIGPRTQKQSHLPIDLQAVLTFDEQQVQADLRLKYGQRSRLRKDKDGGGKIELNFKDATELDNLLNLLGI